MVTIGLTGGIASGKSLVARVFKDLGAHVVDADQIARELLEPGQPALQEVIDHFGRDVLLPDGGIDRTKLGEIVFSDAEKRDWLNSCLHPRVFNVYTGHVRKLQGQPDGIIVFDAALLIETGYNNKMDRTIVVYATRDEQISRLISRNMLSRAQALTRIQSQMPLDEKREYADHVINNTGTQEDTERQARDLFIKIKKEADNQQ
jgi:dephospho-CoA kinase